MKKAIIGSSMLLAMLSNLHAQGLNNSQATIALAKKLGLQQISECTVRIAIAMPNLESLKNSSNPTERDMYKGFQEFAISYIVLGETFGKEQFKAATKKASAAKKDVPDSEVMKSVAPCFSDEVLRFSRNRGSN